MDKRQLWYHRYNCSYGLVANIVSKSKYFTDSFFLMSVVGVDSGGQPAVTLSQDTTVAEVCRALAKARTDAALLTRQGGEMTGIVTSIDLVRSVYPKKNLPCISLLKLT